MARWIELKLVVKDEMEEALRGFAQARLWAFFTRLWPGKKDAELLVYFKRRVQALKAKQELASFIEQAQSWGLKPGKPRWRISQKEEAVWFRKSQKEFVPKKVSRHFVVKPTWQTYTGRPWETVIEIDPQMAFGTGHHFTTRFCLQMLDKWGRSVSSVLDMGCGTGILAIAAAKIGIPKVTAFDNDPLAVKTARENAKINQVARAIRFQTCDLAQYQPRKQELIFANIISGVLLKYKKKIFASVAKNGLLFVTGITREESQKFLHAFQTKAFQLLDQKRTRLWAGFVFKRIK